PDRQRSRSGVASAAPLLACQPRQRRPSSPGVSRASEVLVVEGLPALPGRLPVRHHEVWQSNGLRSTAMRVHTRRLPFTAMVATDLLQAPRTLRADFRGLPNPEPLLELAQSA